MDKHELRKRIDDGWRELEDAFEGLDEAAFSTPQDEGGWTIRDHLAHLGAWERLVTCRLEGRLEDERHVVGLNEQEYESLEIDALNEHIVRSSRDRATGEVIRDLREGHAGVLEALDGVETERLGRPWLPHRPDRGALWQTVAGNTFEHYEEHLPSVRAMAGRD